MIPPEPKDGARLQSDCEAVRAVYPHLHVEVQEERPVLLGTIKIASDCGVERSVQIRVELLANHPLHEPKVFDDADQFRHSAARHFFPDGRCCLWLSMSSEWKADDPNALLHFLRQTTIFFDKQFIYDVIGRWPGKAWGHNEMGYREWLCERLAIPMTQFRRFAPIWGGHGRWGATAPCPCGSGLKYRRCHRARIEAINQLLSDPGDLKWVRRACR